MNKALATLSMMGFVAPFVTPVVCLVIGWWAWAHRTRATGPATWRRYAYVAALVCNSLAIASLAIMISGLPRFRGHLYYVADLSGIGLAASALFLAIIGKGEARLSVGFGSFVLLFLTMAFTPLPVIW